MNIRRAVNDDIPSLYSIAQSTAAFKVSSDIPFYEQEEVEFWIAHPSENIFLVAEDNDTVVGFLFCKIMSPHWAFLDNYYVLPQFRKGSYGKALLAELRSIVRARGLRYVSMLTRGEGSELETIAQKLGFSRQDRYRWWDLQLDASPLA